MSDKSNSLPIGSTQLYRAGCLNQSGLKEQIADCKEDTRRAGGEGGIRTPGSVFEHYDGLANRFRQWLRLFPCSLPFIFLWFRSLSLHKTHPAFLRGTTVATLSLFPSRCTALRLASSLEWA